MSVKSLFSIFLFTVSVWAFSGKIDFVNVDGNELGKKLTVGDITLVRLWDYGWDIGSKLIVSTRCGDNSKEENVYYDLKGGPFLSEKDGQLSLKGRAIVKSGV